MEKFSDNMPLEEQVGILAKYIQEYFPSRIKDGGAIETTIQILNTYNIPDSVIEKEYRAQFHRHGNEVKVSIRSKDNGGVKLQWIVPMEQVLSEVAEDYAERSNVVAN